MADGRPRHPWVDGLKGRVGFALQAVVRPGIPDPAGQLLHAGKLADRSRIGAIGEVFDALMAAGAPLGLVPAGYRALESLRRFKDDVSEVRSGMECGIGVKDYNDVKPGDQIEVFERVEVARSL